MAIGFSTISDDDTFWHVALGQYISENPIATHSPFTFVETSEAWQDPTWLFNYCAYSFYKLGGLTALQVGRVLLIFLLGFTVIKRYGKESMALALLLLLSSHVFSAFRPHMIGLICFSITIGIVNKKCERKDLIYLFFTFLLWQCSHPTWPLFFIAFLPYFINNPIKSKNLGFCFLAMLVSLFITPNSPLETIEMIVQVGTGEAGSAFTTEWLPLLDASGQIYLEFSFIVTLLLLLFRIFLSIKKVDRFHWSFFVLFILTLAMTLKARRFSAFFCIVLLHEIALLLPQLKGLWKLRLKSAVLVATGIICLFLFSSQWYKARHQTPRFATGLDHFYFPEKAVDHLLSNDKVNGRIFNDFDTGGYLVFRAYPKRKPFITGTSVNAELEKQYRRIVDFPESVDSHLKKLDCDQILLGLVRQKYNLLIGQLHMSKEYQLSHLDSLACVYTKKDKARKDDVIKSQALIDSWPSEEGNSIVWSYQAGFLLSIGLFEKSHQAYNKAIKVDPDDVNLHVNQGGAYLQQKNYTAACQSYKKAEALGANDKHFLMLYGNALWQSADFQNALKHYERSYDKGYRHPVLLSNYFHLLKNTHNKIRREEVKEAIELFKRQRSGKQ